MTKCANRGGIELIQIPQLRRKFHYTFHLDEQVTLELYYVDDATWRGTSIGACAMVLKSRFRNYEGVGTCVIRAGCRFSVVKTGIKYRRKI